MSSPHDKDPAPTSDRGVSRIGTDYGLHITVAGLFVLVIAFFVISYVAHALQP